MLNQINFQAHATKTITSEIPTSLLVIMVNFSRL